MYNVRLRQFCTTKATNSYFTEVIFSKNNALHEDSTHGKLTLYIQQSNLELPVAISNQSSLLLCERVPEKSTVDERPRGLFFSLLLPTPSPSQSSSAAVNAASAVAGRFCVGSSSSNLIKKQIQLQYV